MAVNGAVTGTANNGNVTLTATDAAGSVTLGANVSESGLNGTVAIVTAADITDAVVTPALADIAADNISFESTGGNITLTTTALSAPTGTVSLISDTKSVSDTALIDASELVASGATGVNIGNTTAATLNLNSSAGDVSVTDNNTTGVGISGTNTAGSSSTFSVITTAAGISVTGTITAGSVNLQSFSDIGVTSSGSVSSTSLNGSTNLNSTGTGTITLAGNVSGNTVDLNTSGTGAITQTTGGITGGTLDIGVGSGDVTLGSAANNVGELNIQTSGGSNLTFNNAGALDVHSTIGTFGDVAITAGGSITTSNPSNAISGATVTLNATGDIGAAGASILTNTPSDTLIATGNAFVINENNSTLNAAVGGDLSFESEGTITIGANASGNPAVSATNVNLTSDVAVTPPAAITVPSGSSIVATGAVALNGVSLDNNGTITGGSIAVVSTNGDLTVESSTGPGFFNSTIQTTLQSTTGNVDFGPAPTNLTFSGKTQIITAVNGTSQINVGSGAIITALGPLDMLTNTIDDQGTLSGNPMRLITPFGGMGTIENTSGDVVIPGNLTFIGQNLAILASGNIRAASNVTSINLSSKTGNGGALTLVAGFDFHKISGNPLTVPATVPVPSVYQIDAPSTAGGSIYLGKVNINTSSSFAGSALNPHPIGGNVTAVAHAGTVNAGVIQLGTITTSANAKVGVGGDVLLIGQGGVQTKGITTKGANAGQVYIIGAAPELVDDSATIADGELVSPGFTAQAASINNGAGILISGAINTSATAGRGGDVFMLSDSQIESTSGITSTGTFAPAGVTPAGGNVDIQSLFNHVSIKGAINTSATKSGAAGAAGQAGNITIQTGSQPLDLAGGDIFTGALTANGAANLGAGAGGKAGTITLTTNPYSLGLLTPLLGDSFGTIKVNGAISAIGGKASKTGGNGGDGGTLQVTGGTFIVTKTGTSINVKPGLQGSTGTTNGGAGFVNIETYAVQELPTNLDLTSTKATIANHAGGMFSVGLPGVINGVAGSIVSDLTAADTISKATSFGSFGTGFAGQIGNGGATTHFTQGNVQIVINNPNATLTDVINLTTGKRVLDTPSQALFTFAADRGQTTPPGPNTFAVDPTTHVATGGTVTINQLDVNQTTFTGFKIPSTVTLAFTGTRPTLNLPATAALNGTLDFASGATAFINLGSGKMINNGTIGVTVPGSNDTVVLSGTGTTWTNNGTINTGSTGELVIARPSTAPLTFVSGANSSLTTGSNGVLLAPSVDVGMTMNFKATGVATTTNVPGSANSPITLGNFNLPMLYKTNAAAIGTNINTARSVTLSFADSENNAGVLTEIPAVVGGTMSNAGGTNTVGNANLINIKGLASSTGSRATKQTVQTDVTIADGAVFVANTSITATTGGTLTIGTTAGTPNGVVLTAGLLRSSPPASGTLAKTDIVKNGTISLTSTGSTTGAGGVVIGDDSTITDNGSKFNITAKLGDVSIGDGNSFIGNGSNVVILAKGNITGSATGNIFQSQGVTGTSTGGIELGAGTTTSTILSAFKQPSGTRSPSTITGLTPSFLSNGAIVLNPSTATGVDLANGGGAPSTSNLSNGGVLVFDNLGSSTIHMTGSSFATAATKPISSTEVTAPSEVVVDADDDANDGDSATLVYQQ
ncbi:MAG TPA: hypothetical protein V6D22_06870 [Candidatus Obscuribacterales bacterium]